MRPALIAAALTLAASLTACGTDNDDAAGPERRTAAGEVLGGEVSDAMIPLDTVRSTAPVAVRSPEPGESAEPLPSDRNAEDAPSPPQT